MTIDGDVLGSGIVFAIMSRNIERLAPGRAQSVDHPLFDHCRGMSIPKR
jgi:hypothetical protein